MLVVFGDLLECRFEDLRCERHRGESTCHVMTGSSSGHTWSGKTSRGRPLAPEKKGGV